MRKNGSIVLVANWDSNVGYAWWLMESYWAEIAKAYASERRVLIAYPTISTFPPAIADAPAHPVKLDFGKRDLGSIWNQCELIRSTKATMLYFTDKRACDWRYLIYRLCGVRHIVVHDHTPGPRTPPSGLKRLFKTLLHRLPWVNADLLIGATSFVRARLVNVLCAPANRCVTVPNGVPDLESSPTPPNLQAEFSIPSDKKVLVMSARASRYKGVDFVLKSIAALAEEDKEQIHFLLCGDGPDLEALRQDAELLKISHLVTFAGRRTDVPSLLQGCDIAIHPSQGEVGYCLAILEYMRAGLPVIVPDCPSICGATRHEVTGLVFPKGSVTAAAGAISQLLNDNELRSRMGRAAQEDVRQKFRLNSTHQALLDAFHCFAPLPAWRTKLSTESFAGIQRAKLETEPL